jgi:hypothetical protein
MPGTILSASQIIHALNAYQIPRRWVLLLSPFYRWETEDPVKNVTHLEVSGLIPIR